MRRTPNFFAETGRSMLEILAVITIICVFSIGSIIVYNQTNNKQKARNDYEEILMVTSSYLNKGTFRTDKGIADTQWNKKKTRRGNQILAEKNCPQNAITVTVDQISPEVCKELLKKNWNTPQKPLSFYRTAEFGEICSGLPAKITRDGYYITSEADCERVKPSGEWQTFSVSYPMKADVVARRLCKTNAECYSCESCSDANVCESTCGADQYCHSDGTCQEYEDCAENEYRDEKGDCQKCPKNAVCADKKTISGCKEGFYLEEGECKSCPTPQGQGCLDDKDANGCPIYERMICRGTTPVCQSDSNADGYNTCYCPAHAVCTGTSGGSSSTSGNNSGENGEENSEDGFVCEDGYYKSGDTCVECHISGATGCSDAETATSCSENYYLSAGSCISCPANATCAGGTADFVCGSGWEQNETGTACVAAATECSGHGTKDENDTCVCQGGYTGTDCETQITCINGTWTENGCDCDAVWHGASCDSYCDGFMDNSGKCWQCSSRDPVSQTSADECARCANTDYPREINGYDYCVLTTAGCNAIFPDDGGGYRSLTGYCYRCSEAGFEWDVTDDECAQCNNGKYPREKYNTYNCALTSDACGTLYSEGGVRGISGTCHPCSDHDSFITSADECDKCSNREKITYNESIWCPLTAAACHTRYSEGGFRTKNDGYCYSCSYSDRVSNITADECAQCNDGAYPRMMSGNYCVLAPECFGHGTKTNGTCVCDAGYTGTNCQTECSGHGTITNGACVCSSGWYGPLCDSDCDGFRNNSGFCYPCSDDGFFPTTKAECDKCATSSSPRFWGDNGSCYSCSYGDAQSASSDECDKCATSSTPRFRGMNGTCYSCSFPFSRSSSKDECDKCSNREMMGNECVLTSASCYALYSAGGFRNNYGNCWSCSYSSSVYTTKTECDQCGTKRTYDASTESCNKA